MEKDTKIFILGDKSIIGSTLIQHFRLNGFTNVFSESTHGVDLIEQNSVHSFFEREKPIYVFLTYVKSGGIGANMKYPGEFIYHNLQAQNNIMHYSYKSGVSKLLFLGSSCVYPRNCPQPMREEYLLSGSLEKTSEPYAISKIAGIKMCESYNRQYGTKFVSLIPATVYGPYDNFDPETSHVLPALIRKFHEAKAEGEKTVTLWGTGKPHREFIYVDDLVCACLFLTEHCNNIEVLNVGVGEDVSIQELACYIKEIVGYEGQIIFDSSQPDGVFRKLLDSSRIASCGWKATTSLKQGLSKTYEWFLENCIL